MRYRSKILLVIVLCCVGSGAMAQKPSYIESLNTSTKWVDSVFKKLNRNQRIAQMFFIRAHTNLSKAYQDSVGQVIKKERLGGVVFFQGGPGRQIALSNKYQSYSRVPLLVTSDGEWGLGMRLDSTISYPYQMALGAIQSEGLLYKMGIEVARDFKRVGMHMNLSPVVDVNNNAKNPVINYRSFGEDKYNVARKSAAYMKGMQDGGLLVSLKHFPGHGDTDVDSHYDLPLLNFTEARLDSLEMYPFKQLINQGAAGVMIAHMNIPSLDNTPKLPSTLSKPIVTGILKEKLGFKGLIISDAMDMKGVVKYFKDGDAELMGVIAGNDILELAEDTRVAVRKIRKAIRQDKISMERIDESVRKILTAKYWAGLNNYIPASEANVTADLNGKEALELVQQLADASITMLKGKELIGSLNPAARTVIISIGSTVNTTFQKELGTHYTNAAFLNLDKNATQADIDKVKLQTGMNDQVIIGIHDSRTRPGNNMPLNPPILQYISEMTGRNTVFTLFANPYNLANLKGLEKSKGLIIAYQKEDFMQKAAANVLKGKLNATGKLPVSVAPFFKFGDGL
ncbi:MAG: glycoside hydrolase family 3 [Sphingobacteriales bacterium]|nr:MAG: glycoside hydrolase family 3 [Sphingobacteriales bacterium]